MVCWIAVLHLFNESFADADYKSIATELSSNIKDLDLGIGFFNITFQSDDYTVKGLSNLDDLSTQDATEITTELF